VLLNYEGDLCLKAQREDERGSDQMPIGLQVVAQQF